MTKRRDLFRIMSAALLHAMNGKAAGGKITNAVLGAKEARLQREKFGDLRVYFEGATGQLKSLTAGSLDLKPGMSPHAPHQHAEEEIMLITERQLLARCLVDHDAARTRLKMVRQ